MIEPLTVKTMLKLVMAKDFKSAQLDTTKELIAALEADHLRVALWLASPSGLNQIVANDMAEAQKAREATIAVLNARLKELQPTK